MTADPRRSDLTDAEALDAVRSGDPIGVDGLYAHHGWAVHDFCRAVVRDDARAAALTVATFVTAMPLLTELDDPGRVRPLLLSVARAEVLRASRPGGLDDPDVIVAEPADEPDPDVLAGWFWSWLGELDARDRALLDLHVRQRLQGEPLADALMLTPVAAEALRERVTDRATTVLRTQLVALTHASECAELAELVAGWDRAASPLLPAPVSDHVVLCERCAPHQLADPLVLVAAIEAAPLPEGLRARVLDTVVLPEAADDDDLEDDDDDDVVVALAAAAASAAALAATAATVASAASNRAPAPGSSGRPVAPLPVPVPVPVRVAAGRPSPVDGDAQSRLLVGVLVAVGLVALAFIAVLLTRDRSGGGDTAGASVTLPADVEPAGAREPSRPTTAVDLTPRTVAATPTSAPAPASTEASATTTASAPDDAVAGSTEASSGGDAATAPAPAAPAATPLAPRPRPSAAPPATTAPEDSTPPADDAPAAPDTTPDAPAATGPPTPAPAPVTTAPSPAPSPAPAPQSPSPTTSPSPAPPAAGTTALDTTPPRFRAVQVVPGTVREATAPCAGSPQTDVLVDVSDDSGSLTLTGRWTVRSTGATGSFALRDDPLLGWTGDLGPMPDTLTGGASSPLDIVLTAVDPTGNRWSVGTTVTLQDC